MARMRGRSGIVTPKGTGSSGWGIPLLALAAATVLTYANSLGNGLVYDDHFLVEGNRQVREMDLPAIFTTHYWAGYGGNETGQYRPLVILSLVLNHVLHGVSPFGYHLTNVLLHLGNSILAFRLTFRLMGLDRKERGAGEGVGAGGSRARGSWLEGSRLAALCAGLLFAVHPIHAEVAAGVTSGRADLLATLFMFGALLFYFQADGRRQTADDDIRQTSNVERQTIGQGGHFSRFTSAISLSLLCFALALLCKESAVALIGLVLLADLACAPENGIWRAVLSAVRGRWRVYAAFLAVLACYLCLRIALGIGFQAGSLSRLNNPLLGEPFTHRIWTIFALAGRYAGMVIAPLRLSVDYSFDAIPVATSPFGGLVLGGFVSVAAGLWWMARAFRRSRARFFALGFVAITYLPVSQAGPLVNALFQERFLYVPLFGVCVLAGLALRGLKGGQRAVSIIALALAMLLLSGRTAARNRDWRDDASLFESAVRAFPRSVKAQSKLGDSLAERGRLDEAAGRYAEALRLASGIGTDVASIYNNLGNVRHLQGRLDEALEAYRESVKLEPGLAAALNSLGTVSLRKGDPAGAAAWYERLTAVQPRDAEAHYNAGIANQATGHLEEAIRHYAAAVSLRPDYAEAYYNLGNACREAGRRTEAVKAYRRFAETWQGDEQLRDLARQEIAKIEAGK